MKKFNFIGVCILLILILSLSIFAEELTIKNINSILESKKSDKEIKFSSSIDLKDKINIKIEKNNSFVYLKDVKNIDKIKSINIIDNKKFETPVVFIEGAENQNATLILKKNKIGKINYIYHTKDNEVFNKVFNLNFSQNSSHVWFNVSSFSGWTASMDDIYLFHDYTISGSKIDAEIDLSEFSSITGSDCMSFTYIDDYQESTISHSSCASGSYYGTVYSDDFSCFGDTLYEYLLTDSLIDFVLSNSCDEVTTDDYSSSRFRIYDSSGNNILYESNQVYIYLKNFVAPSLNTYSPDNIGTTSARFSGVPNFRDIGKAWAYNRNPDIALRFAYKKSSDSTWSYTDWSSDPIIENEVYYKSVSGLDDNTNYDVKMEISYFSYHANSDGDYFYKFGDTETFTTDGESFIPPSVDTVSAITGDSSVTLRAYVNHNDYTGNDVGIAFFYNTSASSSYIRYPSSAWEVVNDDTTFSTTTISGLTNGDEYKFYPMIIWNSSTMYNDTGDIAYFTPHSRLVNASGYLLYYSFDSDKINGSNIIDSANNYNATYSGNQINITAKVNQSLLHDSTDDYITISSNYTVNGTSPFIVSGWFNSSKSLNTAGHYSMIASLKSSINSGFIIYLINSSGHKMGFGFRSSGNNFTVSPITYTPNTYNFFCNYYKGENSGLVNNYIAIYNNQNLSESISTNGGTSSSNILGIDTALGTAGALNGVIDEFSIFNASGMTENEVYEFCNTRWNNGNGSNPYYTELANEPIISNLGANNISYYSANLRAIPSFFTAVNTSLYCGNFNFRKYNTTNWNNISACGVPIYNNTVFSYIFENLESETQYEYKAYVHNYSKYYLSNVSYFNTSQRPSPIINTLSAINVNNQSATLRGEVTNIFNRTNNMTIYFSILLDNSSEYIYFGSIQNISSKGNFSYNISGLESEKTYYYNFNIDYIDSVFENYTNKTADGDLVSFTTTETGAPVINTLDATNIKRYSADLNCDIVSLGLHDNITMFFRYGNSTNNYTIESLISFNDGVEFSESIFNLSLNTTYNYECIGNYGNNRNISGGIIYFNTLSLSDFIGPEITGFDAYDVSYNTSTGRIYIEIEDAGNSTLAFCIDSVTPYFDTDDCFENIYVNSSGYYTYVMTNLSSDTPYRYFAYLRYYRNSSLYSIYTESFIFNTLSIVESPKSVSIFGFFDIYVENPALFSFSVLLTMLISFPLSIILLFKKFQNILIFQFGGILILFLFIIILIWLYYSYLISLLYLILAVVGIILCLILGIKYDIG